jgi:hypothetical protein
VGDAGDLLSIPLITSRFQLFQVAAQALVEPGQNSLHKLHVSQATLKQLIDVQWRD